MKKWLIFLIGLILGGLLFFILSMGFEGKSTDSNNESGIDSDSIVVIDGLEDYHPDEETYLEEQGEIINEKSFKVFQVINFQSALAYGKDEYGYYNGTLYLFQHSLAEVMSKSVAPLYDDQIIKVPKGKVVRLVGTYTYETRNGIFKTVPKVRIFDN